LVHNFKNGIVSETLDFKSMKHELEILNVFIIELRWRHSKIHKISKVKVCIHDFLILIENMITLGELKSPIFKENEDLVFEFPIKLGGSREISATLEIRYELFKHQAGDKEQSVVSHSIKSIAIEKDDTYLHWSNIMGYRKNIKMMRMLDGI
jgi:hypothetical protein